MTASATFGALLAPARSQPPGPLSMAASAERAAVFDACYREHRDRVYGLCMRYCGGRAAWAEDVTHDVFVKLYEHLPALSDHDDLGAWLYRVAANLSISRIRREQSWLGRLRKIVAADDHAEPLPDDVLGEREAARGALSTLRTLPAKERVVLCMKVLDGKSQREIADALSMSEGYVSKLTARAWARVREAGWEVGDV